MKYIFQLFKKKQKQKKTKKKKNFLMTGPFFLFISVFKSTAYLKFAKIAVCFLWLSLPGDCRVTDEALLAETT